MNRYNEDNLIEQPTKQLFAELGYEVMDCLDEAVGENATLGRETYRDVVLVPKLRAALERLNPSLPRESIDTAVQDLTKDRSALHPTLANKEVYALLKDGVPTSIRASDGSIRGQNVKVIDWETPGNNDFFLASQFWVAGDLGRKRPDLIGFINGLPLVFIELKALHVSAKDAYDHNLSDYKDTIPHLFWYNALTILSNGTESRIGTISSAWEHFVEWPKIGSEEESRTVSLETMIRGTCEKTRLLDIIENFTLFTDAFGSPTKILAKNHQFLGVNNAIKALQGLDENKARLGVFWHTQGSGKSYSMMFFSQKVLRKIPGNWSFVIVTDRQELDGQIYKTFADGDVITEPYTQAESSAHLRQLLSGEHRFVFSLIHKFRTEPGTQHPVLSERSDIIVITDEAHRSQYDTLANNMRNALPNASFLGFTGTPLIAGEERTKEVFGDYISIYDFRQSVEDKATVPLYYENRVMEHHNMNEDLNEEMALLMDEASLDEEQEEKVQRLFSREYQIITSPGHLKDKAKDLVSHFMGRGHRGKAMVVSIDKVTALRTYNYVCEYWEEYKQDLIRQKDNSSDPLDTAVLDAKITYMEETDMALVVSSSQNEISQMAQRGLDIVPHRRRMVSEDMEKKFKDPDDPFRIVFVCAMWITGFDVPSCSTIYLDKPMRNHSLMQTMARANRVFKDKVNGLIVDYVNVFKDLEKALAIYGGGGGGGTTPVLDKSRLIEALKTAIQGVEEFLSELNISIDTIQNSQGFDLVQLLDDAVEIILGDDSTKQRYTALSGDVNRLFKAILPDQRANEFISRRSVIREIERKLKNTSEPVDVSEFMNDVETLLDRSLVTEGYLIRDGDNSDRIVDLSKVDFDELTARFKQEDRKNTEVEKLRVAIDRVLTKMVELNRTRIDFKEKFEELIAAYNSGSKNISELFDELVVLAGALTEEERRHIQEGVTEEELAIFDILTRPDMELTENEVESIRQVAREMLNTLKAEKLVLDWKKRQNTRADVFVTIEKALDAGLPPKFDRDSYDIKCQSVFDHVYDSYLGEGKSVYEISRG
jgi:type I restriction enzyme R subunit